MALQTLYEIDSAAHGTDDVLQRRLEFDPLSQSMENFLRRLVYGVEKYKESLDEVIHVYAPDWPIKQMAIIDRNILRMAIFEAGFNPNLQMQKVVTEAVELAKLYASDNAPRFINGVLGSISESRTEINTLFANFNEPIFEVGEEE